MRYKIRKLFSATLSSTILCIVFSGCGGKQSAELTPENTDGILTWEDRLDAVRSGRTKEIRFTKIPLLKLQYDDLIRLEKPLTVLEIDHSKLSDDQLAALLDKFPSLVQLKLTGLVDDAQMQIIAANAPRIRILNLPDGEFGNKAVGQLSNLKELDLLRFSSPNIDDAGLAKIAKLESIRFLHVIETQITDQGVVAIANMKSLESFYLDGSACTEEGLSELIKQRPDLHFHWNQLHLEDDPNRHPHDE